jgi:hypothetical protein
MMIDLIYYLLAVFVGGIITWLVARYYYICASQDLKNEASELKRLNDLMLNSMEHAGWIELNRDDQGNVRGFVIKLSGTINAKSEMHGNLTIKP